jgi:TIR domain
MADDLAAAKPDIFISYSHIDNEDPPQWVDTFAKQLQLKVDSRWGVRAKIWKDERLDGNDVLQPTILPVVKSATVIVSVVSPGYLQSPWCQTELKTFCDANKTGLTVNGKSRIFKVEKLPIDDPAKLGTIPELLDCTGEKFYTKSKDGKKDVPVDPKRKAEFANLVDNVALALTPLLGSLVGERARLPSTGLTIYLAATSSDLRAQAESLRNSLRLAGHTVLENDPVYTPDYDQRVAGQLARALLSIHPVGDNYATLENSDELIESRAYALANEEAKRRTDFMRVAWRPGSSLPEESRKRAFVATLRDDVDQANMQFLARPLEELKTFVADYVRKLTTPAAPPAAASPPAAAAPPAASPGTAQPAAAPFAPKPAAAVGKQRAKAVYLLYDNAADNAAGSPSAAHLTALRKFLFERGLEVRRPLSEGFPEVLADYHARMLRTCDAVLIYYGNADPDWLQLRVTDLGDPALGRGPGGYAACAVLLAPPRTADKDDYMSHDVPGVDIADPLDRAQLETALREFVDTVQAAPTVAA